MDEKNGIEFLKEHDKLSVNTMHFGRAFKYKLLGIFDDLDSKVSGLLINSENFQALNLLQEKYSNRLDAIYIDPPYNTSATEIIYKNGYKSSSWLSLMKPRLELGRRFLKSDGIQCTTIDDAEYHKLRELVSVVFGEENVLGAVVIKNNPSGRSTVRGFSIAHEYGLFSGKSESSSVGRLKRTEKQNKRYNESDSKGSFEWVNFRKHGGLRADAPRMYYPIFIREDSIRFPEIPAESDDNETSGLNGSQTPDMEWDEEAREWKMLKDKQSDEIVVLPIDSAGQQRRWKWSIERSLKQQEDFSVGTDSSGEPCVRMKSRLNEAGILPLTIWDKSEYSATEHGTNYLKRMFGTGTFSYPKSIWAVVDSLTVLGVDEDSHVMDYFAGSGTTADAVIRLNRNDGGNRKYILAEMGAYVENITLPRILKSAYSEEWRDGKPVSNSGISHMLKCLSLEQYEDTINNINFERSQRKNDLFDQNPEFYEQYMLEYMFDFESRDSPPLLKFREFANPFEYKLNATVNDAIETVNIDLVETFNYLLGLHVFTHREHANGIVTVSGVNQRSEKFLIIWRNCNEIDNGRLNKWFEDFSTSNDRDFNVVFVNCDCTLDQQRSPEENWVLRDIETEFRRLMFSETDR